MITGLGGYSLARNGYYPAVIVNFDIITAEKFSKESLTAYKYFQNQLSAGGSDPKTLDTPQARLEIRRAALDNLVSNSLIYRELNYRFKNDYQSVAKNKIDQVLKNNDNLQAGVKTLYGLELSEFKDQVLLPRAYQEILEGRMFLNSENFNDWLKNSRTKATIIILSPEFNWDGNTISIKK